MNFDILEAAEREVEHITEHYKTIRQGLENEFHEDLARTFKRILNHPKIHYADANGYRRANLRSFPYYVVYTIEANTTLVLAVSHAGRKPKYWVKRLKQG